MGRLCIANPSSTTTYYWINDGAILTGRPFATGPRPPAFTPYFVFADIRREPDPGVLGYGPNLISAQFQDTLPQNHCTFEVVLMRGTWSIDDDLIAYPCRGWLLLMTPRGMALAPNPLMIPAQTD